MARPLRSLISLGSSLPGPSRTAIRPAVVGAGQVRTAFNIAGFDKFLRIPRWKTDPEADAIAENEKISGPVVDEPSQESSSQSDTTGGLFDSLAEPESKLSRKMQKRGPGFKWEEHRYSSAAHKISQRKLALLSRQIAGLPIDEAIVQMQFSEKRASKWVKSTLALARDHAEDKSLQRDKLVVAEAWVSKGRKIARIDIKARGKYGIKHHPSARIHVVLREGDSYVDKQTKKFNKDLNKVRSASKVREYTPLRRKVISGWTW